MDSKRSATFAQNEKTWTKTLCSSDQVDVVMRLFDVNKKGASVAGQ